MAKIGQIVYNLEDYGNSGGLVSTSTTGSLVYSADGEAGYKSSRINIYAPSNLVPAGTRFMKIGIQAPPGTKVILNTDKTILIGQSGIYELDEDIAITSMYFIEPQTYIYDSITSQAKITQGQNTMKNAEINRYNDMAQLAKDDTDEYIRIQTNFIKQYNEGLALYRQGKAGVYILDEKNKGDLYNIIIDYVQEGG